MDGVLILDKPVGPTSFEVVRRVQHALAPLAGLKRPRDFKAGHGGTLDPLASGVLPLCFGEATKLAAFLLDADKEYVATVRFGAETDTLDAAGVVLARTPASHLTEAAVAAALPSFRGAITQVPPMYSALKHQGRPLHAYARQGEEIAREARPVTVFALELLRWQPGEAGEAELHVRCSKGTYVRVLAADLGRALGVGAHLIGLRRTRSGPFRIEEARDLDDVERQARAGQGPALVPLSDVLAHFPALCPPAAICEAVWQGKRPPCAALGLPDDAAGRYRVLRADGTLLAVVEAEAGVVRSLRGFQAPPGGPAAPDTGADTGPAAANEAQTKLQSARSAVAPETKLSSTFR
jgi:tRNA pseudouridine55 synthase